MGAERTYEKEGQHWVESIGIPGTNGCHFSVSHRRKKGVNYISKIKFSSENKTSDVFELVGIKTPRVYVSMSMSDYSYNPVTNESCVPYIRNITELVIALHEVAHQAQTKDKNLPSNDLSVLEIKNILEKQGIKIDYSNDYLESLDLKVAKYRTLDSEEEKKIVGRELNTLDGLNELKKIGSIMLEQDATGRVFSAFSEIEKIHGIDFSKVKLNPEKSLLTTEDSYTLFPWFDEHSITASLDFGLASHKADTPIFMICKRLLGDKCMLSTSKKFNNINPLGVKPKYRK